mmetsp:Transcript_45817/g.109331  ORF Transcript_45817/g.109331 Transcript_45817/m.109331 type:complete len:206 (+) Transcript_45817:258-875(+)
MKWPSLSTMCVYVAAAMSTRRTTLLISASGTRCPRDPVPAREMRRNIAHHISTSPTARMSPAEVSFAAIDPVTLKVSDSPSPSRPRAAPKPEKNPHATEKHMSRDRVSSGLQTLSTHSGKRLTRNRYVGRWKSGLVLLTPASRKMTASAKVSVTLRTSARSPISLRTNTAAHTDPTARTLFTSGAGPFTFFGPPPRSSSAGGGNR